MQTTTGHTIAVDLASLTLTIAGPTETMDAIPDAELDAAARAAGVVIDWDRGPLDETTYAVVEMSDGEPDRLQTSLDAAAEASNEERRRQVAVPPGYFEN